VSILIIKVRFIDSGRKGRNWVYNELKLKHGTFKKSDKFKSSDSFNITCTFYHYKDHTKTTEKKATINTNTTITTIRNEKHNSSTKFNKEFTFLTFEKTTICDKNPQLIFIATIMHGVSKSKYS
jgi:hypothetical protein